MNTSLHTFHIMVRNMMRRFGFKTTYIHQRGSVSDDSTGEVIVDEVEIEVEAIRQELIRPDQGSGTKPNTLISDGDVLLYVRPTEQVDVFEDAIAADPTSDRIIVNGIPWRIVTVKQHDPTSNDNVVYEIYVRK